MPFISRIQLYLNMNLNRNDTKLSLSEYLTFLLDVRSKIRCFFGIRL